MSQPETTAGVSFSYSPNNRPGGRWNADIGIASTGPDGTVRLSYNTNGTTSLSVQNPYGYGATLSRPGF